MFARGIFLISVAIVCGYNIDTNCPIIHSHVNVLKGSNNYFGYSVHLYCESASDTPWLIVGAPKGNYSSFPNGTLSYLVEPGVVYRCAIKNYECQEIKPQKIENESSHVQQIHSDILIRQQYGWFGSAISIDEFTGVLTVCAPRTTIFLKLSNMSTLQGMCYTGNISSNSLYIEDRHLSYHNFKMRFWYNPIHGFSVHYASEKENAKRSKGEVYRIVGAPKYEDHGSVDIHYLNKRMTIKLPESDELSQFGYSVASGYFFRNDELLFTSGAPGWNYSGLVGIIDASNRVLVTRLYGNALGEFFGATLAVGDLNNDGLDDLLVGAPYWGEDNGRVYAYLGSSKRQFELVATLQGIAEGSHFGYAIASGDLDLDGFDDIIVGAPWEGNGVIYIYNGGANMKDTNLQISQRIEATRFSRFSPSRQIERFGFSISKPVDIDKNGYPDIAIGAYKSQQAVILRSRPVVKTELVITITPNTLQRNTTNFLLEICTRYSEYNMQNTRKYKITVTIDEQYQRTENTILELKSSDLTSNNRTCLTSRVNILGNIQDFIEPIVILARHDFIYGNTSCDFCEICPIERKNDKLQTVQTLLPFNIDCGEDKVCNANTSISVKFYNVRNNDTWVIGSDDISLETSLKNYGEPAYLTTLEFTFPKNVVLRSILPSCQEDASQENLIVICDVGNPIQKDEEKGVKLDLDMRRLINGSLYDHKLYFRITIRTRSVNLGTRSMVKAVTLVNNVSLSLQGKANEETYYLTTLNEAAPNISFQHSYQVYKLGASPLEDAQLIVKVPLAINGSETLVQVYKPQLYISGERFECSSENTLLDVQTIEMEEDTSFENFNLFSNNTQQSGVHKTEKRDLEELYSMMFYDRDSIKVASPQITNETLPNVIYMNCSSPDVNCTTIVCNLNALKMLQDIGKIAIRLILDIDKLQDNFGNNGMVLRFATEARVEITKPEVRLRVNGTRSQMEVVTMFYNSPKMEKLQLWVVIASVLVGLLLLLIFAAILSTMGFFKRKAKEELKNSKNNEAEEPPSASKSETT